MLRSCSMLDKPEGMEEYFVSYKALAEDLSRVDYDHLTAEEFQTISERLENAAEEKTFCCYWNRYFFLI